MPKARPTVRHLATEPSEANHAEGLISEVAAERELPAAVVDRSMLERDAAHQRKDEAPGQLRGGGASAASAAHRHARVAQRLEVE